MPPTPCVAGCSAPAPRVASRPGDGYLPEETETTYQTRAPRNAGLNDLTWAAPTTQPERLTDCKARDHLVKSRHGDLPRSACRKGLRSVVLLRPNAVPWLPASGKRLGDGGLSPCPRRAPHKAEGVPPGAGREAAAALLHDGERGRTTISVPSWAGPKRGPGAEIAEGRCHGRAGVRLLRGRAVQDVLDGLEGRKAIHPSSAEKVPVPLLLLHRPRIGTDPREGADLVPVPGAGLRQWP